MKVCKECQQKKSIDDFYKHKGMSDGRLGRCIECVKQRVRKNRLDKIDYYREYDKFRSSIPKRVSARKEYLQTDNGKASKQKAQKNYRERYPMKYAAHVITRNAIRDGKLKVESQCSVCQSTLNVEAHHDDYSKPLDVRWLCERCHKNWHRYNKPIYF